MGRALDMQKLFSRYLIPYKEWKVQKMKDMHLDSNNPNDQKQVNIDMWDDSRKYMLKYIL